MVRVCLFTDSLEPSGVGEHMVTLLAELRHRYDLSFVCSLAPAARPFLERAARLGVEVAAFDSRDERGADEFRRWLEVKRFDVFHGHGGVAWEGHDGVRVARAAGVPAIVRTEHFPYSLLAARSRVAYLAMVSRVDRLICVSAGQAESYRGAGVPGERIRVILNGILPGAGTGEAVDLRAGLGLPGAARVVLSVGRLTWQKDHRRLVDALPGVLERVPDVYVLVVGEGPLRAALNEHSDTGGLGERFRLLGHSSDAAALMGGADVFVLPSVIEGLPLVALEAMAVGLPVIGSRVGGIDEVVVDGVTGRLIDGRDPVALASAIAGVLEDPSLAARWGAAGRQRVKTHFTSARMAAETAEVYDALAARPGTSVGQPAAHQEV